MEPPPVQHSDIDSQMNQGSGRILDAAVRLQKELGPGLLEKTYRVFLAQRLRELGCTVAEEVSIPVVLGDTRVEQGLRVDLIVDGQVLIELKAVAALQRIHTAQVLTYLRLTDLQVGLLLNFNTIPLGVRRLVHTRPS